MKLVPLTNIHKTKVNAPRRYVAIVSDCDYSAVSRFHWYASRERGRVYAARDDGEKTIRLSRFILGISDPKVEVQFLDGDGLNLQRSNLRVGTHNVTTHRRTKKSGCTSQFRGVSWCNTKNRWRATLKKNGVQVLNSYHQSEKQAAREYDRAARHYYGVAFAKCNFVQKLNVRGN